MAYDNFIALAQRLLRKRGKSVVIKRTGLGAIDPLAGSRASGGDQTATFLAVGLPPGKSADKEVGSLVNRKITMFYMTRTAGSLDPTPGDTIPWGGTDYICIYSTHYDPDASGKTILTVAYGEAGG